MKDEVLTLRLSRELAQALSRWARDRGVPRSEVVREAVSGYVTARDARPVLSPTLTAAELAARIREAIALVDLTGKERHKPDQLSPGDATELGDVVAGLEAPVPGAVLIGGGMPTMALALLWRSRLAWVMALPEFDDDPKHCGERILEAIQQAWIDEVA